MDIVVKTGAGSAPGDAAQESALFLPLFTLITQARNEHGMRQQDVRRYRQFCSTKVHHLRQILHKTHVPETGRHGQNKQKGSSQSSKKASKKVKRQAQSAAVQSQNNKGKGNVFTRKSILVDDVHNDRPLQLLLFEAERAWAYSQELKQVAFAKEQDGSIRRHGLARAHRAVQWATSLRDLVTALGDKRVDVLSRAEVAAYHVLIRGYEAFDKSKDQESLDLLSVARKILDMIAEASDDSRKEALANSFVDSTEPMLRFSAYNLQLSETNMESLAGEIATPQLCKATVQNYEGLEAELQEKAKGAANADKSARLDHVDWRGKSIPIRHPDLVDATSKVQSAEIELRTALEAKNKAEEKPTRNGNHKRQRLTSAQRSAKRRGQLTATTSADSTQATSAKAATAGSRTRMDGYDSLLAALTEAEDVSRRLEQDNAEALSKSHSGRYEAASTILVEAHEYMLYKLLAARIERNAALIEEVQAKSGKRQIRLREALNAFLESSKAKGHQKGARMTAKQKGKQPVQRRVKTGAKKIRPSSRARKAKTGGKRESNGPQKTRAHKQSHSARTYDSRMRSRAELRSRRIAVRTVPGLAKLLDANEMSCSTISGLGIVENDSDLTTLIEAKSAWFKAELLRFLARSFAFTNEEGKGLICLQRAELFVREAQTAMELVDAQQVSKEDKLLPPSMNAATFETTTRQIAEARLEIQRQVYLQRTQPKKVPRIRRQTAQQAPGAAAATRNAQSKAAQAVRDMASKYVEFDTVDLQQACQLNTSLEAQFASELGQPQIGAERARAAATSKPSNASASKTDEEEKDVFIDEAPEEAFDDAVDQDASQRDGDVSAAYDPTNALYEEEERAAAEASNTQKRGWLGGWLGRK